MENIIIILVIALIIALIVRYLYKAKKNGQACIGCPSSKQCAGKQGGCGGCSCGCGGSDDTKPKEEKS